MQTIAQQSLACQPICGDASSVAEQIEAGLSREEELAKRLGRLHPWSPHWKATLRDLDAQSRLISSKMERHAELQRAEYRGIFRHDHRLDHAIALIRILRDFVHRDSLRELVQGENRRRCVPPLPKATLDVLLTTRRGSE